MRCPCFAAVLLAVCSLLSGCSSNGISGSDYNPGYGPFDKHGNYVEAWADQPAKKHKWGRKPKPQPEPEPEPRPTRVARTTPPPTPDTRVASSSRTVSRPPAPKPTSRPVTASKPKPTVAAASTAPKPKPKPKPTPVKPSKPAPVKHTVKKGDTLYSLARRYGSSVSSIQKANGLSGSTIRIGQALSIPR